MGARASEFCASIISQTDEVRQMVERMVDSDQPFLITELIEIDELIGNVRDELIEGGFL